MSTELDSSLIAIGKFGRPYGLRGWLYAISFTDPPTNLLNYQPWLIQLPTGELEPITQFEHKIHNQKLLIKFPDCNTPEQAQHYTNQQVFISRKQLPKLANEYYWTDLLGLTVINTEGITLGTIDRFFTTASNDVFVITNGQERLLPYLPHIIKHIDLTKKVMRVDWDAEF